MPRNGQPITILMADDDPEDTMLAKEALGEARLANGLLAGRVNPNPGPTKR